MEPWSRQGLKQRWSRPNRTRKHRETKNFRHGKIQSVNRSKLYCAVMAGGSGTRFWPWSRVETPKQFLAIGTQKPLIVETIDRLAPLVDLARIRVVAGVHHAEHIRRAMPKLLENQLILEPQPKNTAPCIGLAALHVSQMESDAVLAVLPADHHIGNVTSFLSRVTEAVSAATQGKIVTMGIQPTRPETGYGYIEIDESKSDNSRVDASLASLKSRTDKTALNYVSTGRYLWNSGMFFFRCDVILRAIRTYLPDLANCLEDLRPHIGQPTYSDALRRMFDAVEPISIDYGVMEPLSRTSDGIELRVIPSDIDWNDVGHWAALSDFAQLDAQRNVRQADDVLIDCEDNVFQSDSGMIAAIGVKNLVVIRRNDVVLVCPRERAQDVRSIVDALKRQGRDDMV